MKLKQKINNKENLSLNTDENKYIYDNIKQYEEEKNEQLKSFLYKENLKNKDSTLIIDTNTINTINNSNNSENILNNINNSFKEGKIINLKDNISISNDDDISKKNESKKISFENEEILSNDIFLDEIKLKVDYDKIESEINRLKNNNDNINIDNNINIDDLPSINNKDIKNQRVSIYSNSQVDFCYSDEEDDKIKHINSNSNSEKINMIQENLYIKQNNKIKENENIITNEKKNIQNIDTNINNEKMHNNNISKKDTNNNNNINTKILEKVEYGIDETGNPISIKNYKEELSKNKNIKKLIAYIIQLEGKDKNYLINLKGDIIPKMEDGDFNYKDKDNIRIIIKNFDVQNPKLRVFGSRLRYSSIVLEDENNSQNLNKENEILPKENKHLILFKQIKENLSYPSKRTSSINFSPIINMNNNYKRDSNLNENIKNNENYNVWKKRYSPNHENRRIYHYKRNKNEMLYKKKLLKRINNHDLMNLSKNNKSNCLILKKTNDILNKSENREIFKYNHNILDKFKNKTSINNFFLDNSRIGSNTWRINRTPSPMIKLKDLMSDDEYTKNKTSRVNIYQTKRNRKCNNKIYNNCNNIFKLNLDNKSNSLYTNSLISNNEKKILKNSFSSFFKLNNNSNPKNNNLLFNNSEQQLLTNSYYSSFVSHNNSNIKNKKMKKNPLLRKSLSTNNCILASTLNNIAKNIKNIENNIKTALEKINLKNKKEKFKRDTSIPSNHLYNSKNYLNYDGINNYFRYSSNSNNKKVLSNSKSNNNFNRRINLRKIPLNKKYKISTSPKKQFQCTVLSYEADKMIKDYTNKSIIKKNINENNIKKCNLYNNDIRKSDYNKNKLFQNKNKNRNNKKDNSPKKLNKSYNDLKSGKSNILKIKIEKNIKANANKNIKLGENKSFNKIYEKKKNIINENKLNNNKNFKEKILTNQNYLHNNIYVQKQKPIIKNTALRLMNKVKKQKMSQNLSKKISTQSTSITLLKENLLNEK